MTKKYIVHSEVKKKILNLRYCSFILLLALSLPQVIHAQNLVLNGSMTSAEGENVVAPNWIKHSPSFPNANSPDVNDAIGPLNCVVSFSWAGGLPTPSPDGGTWQNVFSHEDFKQTISGLTIGATYYFRYYYASQGITSYTTPQPPSVTIIGATGYANPPVGTLFEWKTYSGSLVATATSITIIASQGVNVYAYMAFDGFYLGLAPPPDVLIISQPQPVMVCNNGDADFSIQAVNATAYQWQINIGTGWIDITNGSLYSGTNSNSLHITNAGSTMNNYQYRCYVTSACCNTYSFPATLTVFSPVTPSITIQASATTICAGTSVVFNAIPSNAGTNPTYQWKKNGTNTGSNSSNYTDNNIADADVITCTITSANPCQTTNTATSNSITMIVTAPVNVLVTISPSSNNICFGKTVTFTSTIVNGGTTPLYTWFKNSVNLFLNSPTYTDNSLNNGDHIMCAIQSSLTCVISQVAVSNDIMMNVVPSVTPSVSIISSADQICAGTSVLFTSNSVNGGSSPSYQWKKNNVNVGSNSSTYTSNNLSTGDVISCVLTSNSTCATIPTSVSNNIAITVFQNPAVSLDHTNTLCNGNMRYLNAGSFSSYLWNDGSTVSTLPVNGLGVYYVTVTDNNGCKGSDTTKITTLFATPAGFLPADTTICTYGNLTLKARASYNNYSWSNNSNASSVTITQPGIYWLEVIDGNNCVGKDSILVSPKYCGKGFFIPNAFTPNGDGKNDVFKPILLGNVKQYNFSVFNRWGQIVFQSNDQAKGWNGDFKNMKQSSNVFVWTCAYQFEGEERKIEKGTVVVIR